MVTTLTGSSGTYSGTVSGTVYNYTGTAFSQYNNLVAATLRSRGIANYVNDNGPVYTVSGLTSVIVDDSGTYSAITQNPFASFAISPSLVPTLFMLNILSFLPVVIVSLSSKYSSY